MRKYARAAWLVSICAPSFSSRSRACSNSWIALCSRPRRSSYSAVWRSSASRRFGEAEAARSSSERASRASRLPSQGCSSSVRSAMPCSSLEHALVAARVLSGARGLCDRGVGQAGAEDRGRQNDGSSGRRRHRAVRLRHDGGHHPDRALPARDAEQSCPETRREEAFASSLSLLALAQSVRT